MTIPPYHSSRTATWSFVRTYNEWWIYRTQNGLHIGRITRCSRWVVGFFFASEIRRRVSIEKISHHFLVCRVVCDTESERIEDSSPRRHVSWTYTLPYRYLTSIPAAFLTSFQHLVSTETHQRTPCVGLIRRGWKTGEKGERHRRRNFD